MVHILKRISEVLCCRRTNNNDHVDHFEGPPPTAENIPNTTAATVDSGQVVPRDDLSISPAETQQLEQNFENLKVKKALVWKTVDSFNEDAYWHPEALWHT